MYIRSTRHDRDNRQQSLAEAFLGAVVRRVCMYIYIYIYIYMRVCVYIYMTETLTAFQPQPHTKMKKCTHHRICSNWRGRQGSRHA